MRTPMGASETIVFCMREREALSYRDRALPPQRFGSSEPPWIQICIYQQYVPKLDIVGKRSSGKRRYADRVLYVGIISNILHAGFYIGTDSHYLSV